MKLVKPSVEVIFFRPELQGVGTEELIEIMGRISHASEPKGTASKFIKMIKRKGHYSVLEFGGMIAKIVTSRGIADELRTHRLTSPIMQSTRFCDYSNKRFGKQVSFIDLSHRYDDNVGAIYQAYDRAEQSYLELRDNKVPAEIARDVLPLGVATVFGIQANFREWMHIFKLRCDSAAHPDVRMLMGQVRDKAVEKHPAVFGDIDENHE